MRAFVRQLGYQPGIQLDPLNDESAGYAPDQSDQVFAMALRARRGRIDRCFTVNRSNVARKLGPSESIRANALNEAYVQLSEAVNKGAMAAVVHRLVPSAAVLKYIVITADATTGDLSYAVSTTIPVTPFIAVIKHLECYSDGISISVHADEVKDSGGTPVDATMLTVTGYDPAGVKVFSYTGSLDPTELDDFGKTAFLTDIVASSALDPVCEVTVGANAKIKVGSNAYGRDATTGLNKVASSAVLAYFVDGGTTYDADDYALARTRLTQTPFDYKYIASGGSQATGLLAQLAQLAYDMNRQFRYDVPGSQTPDEAIAWIATLGFDTHLCQAFWAPIECDDPLNGGRVKLGTSALNIAMACKRNAVTDARGFAKKNQPIAGKAFPIQRTGMRQIYTPDEFELSDLARAKINPVLFDTFNDGSAFIFTDSLTNAQTESSFRKLIAVADMSTDLDEVIVRFGKETLQLPMSDAVDKQTKFMQKLFENAEASKWLVPTDTLDGKSFQFTVQPDAVSPADKMQIKYSLRYDGTNRQIEAEQTIVR